MSTARQRGISRAVAVSTSTEALVAIGLVVVQIGAIVAYFATADVQLLSVTGALYPVLWISLSAYFVLALARRGPTVSESALAIAVGVGYFVVLMVVGGLLWPSHQLLGHHHHTSGTTLLWASPGWGPVVLYSNSVLQLSVIPFKIAGYGALAYGVAAAVAASSRGALAGLFGVFTCVGCLLPLAAVVGGIFGGASTLLATLGGSYEFGTAVFVLTILLLLVAIPTSEEY